MYAFQAKILQKKLVKSSKILLLKHKNGEQSGGNFSPVRSFTLPCLRITGRCFFAKDCSEHLPAVKLLICCRVVKQALTDRDMLVLVSNSLVVLCILFKVLCYAMA